MVLIAKIIATGRLVLATEYGCSGLL